MSVKSLYLPIASYVIFLLLLVNSVFADENTYVVGVENQPYLPHFTYENGKYEGFARDLMDSFAQAKGYKFVYKPLPVNRLYSSMLNGKVDFKYPDSPLWQSELKTKSGKKIFYSSEVVQYLDGTLVLPKNKNLPLEQLGSIGTVRGFTPWVYIDHINNGIVKVKENSKLPGLIKQVLAGRVNAAYFSIAVAKNELEKMNKTDALVYTPNLPHSTSYYHLSSTTQQNIVKEFSQFLVEDKSRIQKLKEKYRLETKL